MAPEGSPRTRLLLGVLASLALHAALAAAITPWARTAPAQSAADALRQHEHQPPRHRLGVRDANATTFTWVGFREPTPHQARQGDVEQAQQTLGRPAPAGAPGPVADAAARAVRAAAAETQAALREALDWMQTAAQRARTLELPEPDQGDDAEPTETQTAQSQPADQPDANEQAEPSASGGAEGDSDAPPTDQPQGDAERDAPAVSIDEPVEIRPGKPVAAEGVEIYAMARPDWSIHVRLTARPRNPRILIRFDDAGYVRSAEVLESSGRRDVDRPLLDAVYNWRARGKAIDELLERNRDEDADRTFDVRMRILLN